jgi:hypothetical protein
MKHSSPTEVGRGQRLSKTWNSRSGSVSLIDWQEPENNAHVLDWRERAHEFGLMPVGDSDEAEHVVRHPTA